MKTLIILTAALISGAAYGQYYPPYNPDKESMDEFLARTDRIYQEQLAQNKRESDAAQEKIDRDYRHEQERSDREYTNSLLEDILLELR